MSLPVISCSWNASVHRIPGISSEELERWRPDGCPGYSCMLDFDTSERQNAK